METAWYRSACRLKFWCGLHRQLRNMLGSWIFCDWVKKWVHGVGHYSSLPERGSTGLAILQSTGSVCRLSWELRLHPPRLLGPVLLGCCRLQPTSLSSMIVLQPPLLCEGWCGHPLCLSGGSPVLMDRHWPCDCKALYSILSIGSISLVLLWGTFLNGLGQ